MIPPIRLTAVMTHPVQYAAPWFRHIATQCADLELTVIYATQPTPERQGTGFDRAFQWDVPLTAGYCARIVRAAKPADDVSSERFWGLDVPEVAAAIAESKPGVVLLSGWHSVTLLRSLWACRRLGVPVLYRGDTNLVAAPPGWRKLTWAARTWFLLRSFDGYLSVGQRSRAYLEAFGIRAARIFDAPHCVDNAFFAATAAPHQRPEAREAVRRQWGFARDDFVVVFVGKMEAKKRPCDLVHATASIEPGVRLLMVGAGLLEPTVRTAAQRGGVRCAWAGFLNQSELGKAYAAADCLALPSDGGETWGLVVNEAMAAGVPCVVSDRVGCAPDLVIPGETGEVFPVGDPSALAAALQRVRDGQKAGHDFATACRVRIARYSFAAATAGLVAAARAVARPPASDRRAQLASSPPRVMACCGGMVIVSGLERSTFEVLRVLRERKAAVHCLVNSWENHRIVALAEEIGASWSTTYHWYPFERSTRNPIKWAQVAWDVFLTSFGLLRDARRFRATHVLVPEFLSVLRNAPGLMLLRLASVLVVLRVGNAPARSPFYRRIWRWGVAPFVDAIVCNSHFARRELLANGVPERKLHLISGATPTRADPRRNGIERDRHKVIYVGQIIPEKGLDLLLEAVGLLAHRGHDVRLDVVGQIDGWEAPAYVGYRDRILERARAADLRGRVQFLGWREDVPALMAAAGVHCCPSRPEMLEGLPLVALEAKAAGLPSVAFPVGPFPELIAHRHDGWLCADVSAAALADGLEYFVVDPQRQEQAGHAALASATRFDRRRFADAWSALFERRHGT